MSRKYDKALIQQIEMDIAFGSDIHYSRFLYYIGWFIRHYRRAYDLTKRDLSDMTRVNFDYLKSIETPFQDLTKSKFRGNMVSHHTLNILCKYLGFDLEYEICFPDNPPRCETAIIKGLKLKQFHDDLKNPLRIFAMGGYCADRPRRPIRINFSGKKKK